MPKVINEETIIGDILHQWSFPEYETYIRSRAWYILVGSLGFILLSVAVLTGNFLFALIIVLFAIIIYLQDHQMPSDVSFGIATTGILVGSRHYQYGEFDSFYIIYNPPQVKTLYLITKNMARPRLAVPLQDEDPVKVRDIIKQFVVENTEEQEEPFSDTFRRNWMLG